MPGSPSAEQSCLVALPLKHAIAKEDRTGYCHRKKLTQAWISIRLLQLPEPLHCFDELRLSEVPIPVSIKEPQYGLHQHIP